MAFRVLVSDSLSKEGLKGLEGESDFEVIYKPKLSPDELKKEIKTADALLIRSGTQVTRDILEAADNLKVVGRAGVGLDNVDVPAATERGVVVMNTPDGNTISTAEHTITLLMALSRHIMPSGAEVRDGIWDRKKFSGAEVYGKTLGVIGCGKIGAQVALRMQAFCMKTIGFDPFVSEEVMRKNGIEPVSLDDLFARSDYITLHVPINDNTRELICAKNIAKMKDGVRIINCSRAGVVNEAELDEALKSGKVAGAALDFLKDEKNPASSPLPKNPKCLVTPHLGASTEEAQERVAIGIVDQIKEFLRGGPARNAANIPSVDSETLEMLGSHIRLAEKMGILATKLRGDQQVDSASIRYHGELADVDTSILTLSILKGLLTPMVQENVNFVNAPGLAKERGLKYSEAKSTEPMAFTNMMTVALNTGGEEIVTISGSVFPRPMKQNDARIVRINGYHVDARPTGTMIILRNEDKPGIVGAVGTILGEAGINIADMTLGRKEKGQQAVTVFNVEGKISPAVHQKIAKLPNIIDAKVVELG